MAREVTSAFLTQLTAGSVRPFMMFEGHFYGGNRYVWTGMRDVSWNSVTWEGVGGDLIRVSQIAETTETRASGVEIQINGIDSTNLSQVLQSLRQSMAGVIYFGFLNSAGTIIADPVEAFRGRMDSANIEDSIAPDGRAVSICTLKYENRLIDLERVRTGRYTMEDQRLLDPTDLGMEFVNALQDQQIDWGVGTPPASSGNGGTIFGVPSR